MKKEILKTLAYADVFDYPLKKEEIWKWLIWEGRSGKGKDGSRGEFAHSFEFALDSLQICVTQGFYHLQDRGRIVRLRKQREQWSNPKLRLAGKVAGILRKIPWIKMIGITGALAMENSDKEDDIDLFIIASKNRLWLTRGLIVTFLRLFGLYRRPGKIKDKICPNMLLDEDHLMVPKKEQDLFSAHEVCQMKPVWDRDNTYSKFLQANLWVRRFLPNGVETEKLKDRKTKKQKSFSVSSFLSFLVDPLEQLAYKLQLAYMNSRKTSEITESGRIRFHPQDARVWVLEEYQKRLVSLNMA